MSTLQTAVDAWLLRHEKEIQTWEGTFTEEDYSRGDLSNWLPGYNHGVYIVGERDAACVDDCEGCVSTPLGHRTCNPYVKIGRASNMYQRFANLKTGSPRELEILTLMPFAEPNRIERELHGMFKELRVNVGRKGEWFWLSPEMESLISEVMSYGAEFAG